MSIIIIAGYIKQERPKKDLQAGGLALKRAVINSMYICGITILRIEERLKSPLERILE